MTSTTTMTTTIEQYGTIQENDICDKTLYLTLIICSSLKNNDPKKFYSQFLDAYSWKKVECEDIDTKVEVLDRTLPANVQSIDKCAFTCIGLSLFFVYQPNFLCECLVDTSLVDAYSCSVYRPSDYLIFNFTNPEADKSNANMLNYY